MPNKPSYEELEQTVAALMSKNAELEREKKDCRELLENLNEVVYRVDPQTRITYISSNIERIAGYTPDEVIGRTFKDFLHPDDLPKRLESYEHILKGAEYSHEYRYLTKNRGYAWGYTRHKPIFNGGEVVAVQGVMVDITDRKKMENSLRESERKFQMLTESVPEVFWLTSVGESEKIEYVSPSFREVWGKNPEDLYQNPRLWVENIHHEDRERVEETFARLIEQKKEFDIEFRLVRDDGSVRWIHDKGYFFYDTEEDLPRLAGIAQDITDKKQIEQSLREGKERYRFLVEESNDIVWTFDLSCMKYSYCSQSVERILGIPQAETNDAPLDAVFGPEAKKKVISAFAEAIENQSDRVVIEAEHYHREGGTVLMEISATLQRDSSNDPVSFTGISRDISLRRQAEQEREELRKQLQRAQKSEALRRLAGAVAHHFNNQLAVILGNLELAEENVNIPAEVRRNLIAAIGACQQASHISGQMLAYLGQGRGQNQTLDLSELCRQHLPQAQHEIPARIELQCILLSPGPVVVANKSDLKQAISGMIRNAKEAIGDSSGTITVTTKTEQPGHSGMSRCYPAAWEPKAEPYACLEVADTGCGISKEDMDRIFDPFFSTKSMGRGLGLAVLLGIARAKMGGIEVCSNSGHGTTFRLFLPLVPDNSEKDHHRSTKERKIDASGTVLLVEDREEVRQLVEDILLHLKYKPIPAENGEEALDFFRDRSKNIDCVITDLSMPGIDGWETLDAIKDISPETPVILASGFDEKHVMDEKEGRRPDAFIQKPYKMTDLKAVLNRLLSADGACN